MSLRSWLLVGLLLGTSCDSLFGSFARPNPKNCVRSPDICSAAEFCDTVSERCVSIAPDAELFAPLSRPHEFSFDHILSGNFDGNGVPDAVLVGPGRALVLYNPGTSLATQKVLTTNTTKQPFYALATRVDTDALDDLVIVTERGNSSNTEGTIEFCAAASPDSLQPFACLQPRGLQFVPKAFLISDLIDDSTPELAAIDERGGVQVCRVLSVSGMQGACEELANPEPMLYGQMALLDDVNGDGRRDIGLLMQPMASGPKVRVLRSNAGAKPTLSDPTGIILQSPELVAGNFNHSGKISLVAIGNASGGTIVAQPFYDLSGTAPVASAMVEAQAGSLAGDPLQGRATAVGQLDGVGGPAADDIAALLSNGQLALFVGSAAGIKTQVLPGSFTPIFGSHLLAAPFTTHVGGRYDLLVYGDPLKTRVDLMAFLRNTGSSSRGMFTRSTVTDTRATTTTTPDYVVLSGKFGSPSARELALLPRAGSTLTVLAHDGTGLAASPSFGSPLDLPDLVESATVLPCAEAPDAIAIAFRTEKRPFIYRQGTGGLTPQILDSSVNLLQTLAADLNGDGLSDLVVLRADGKVQAALAQSRTCALAPLTDLIPPTLPLPLQIAVGDP